MLGGPLQTSAGARGMATMRSITGRSVEYCKGSLLIINKALENLGFLGVSRFDVNKYPLHSRGLHFFFFFTVPICLLSISASRSVVHTIPAIGESPSMASEDDSVRVKEETAGPSPSAGESYHIQRAERTPYGPPGVRGLFHNPFVTLCAACSTLGGVLFGYDQGVVSIVLVMPHFLETFPLVSETAAGAGFWKGLMTAMIELGALLGALNQGWIADKYSRRYSIVIAVIIFTIGSILQTAAINYAMLVVARLIGGIGIGMLSMVAPLYISEVSPPEVRGTLLVMEEFCIVLGIVIAYYITYGTRYMPSDWSWRLPFFLQMLPGFVLIAGVYLLPFSPRWLVFRGREPEALESLCRLRRLPETDARVKQEFFDIQVEVRFHKEISAEKHPNLQDGSRKSEALLEVVSWIDCFKPGCWRRTHVGVGIMFFQQVCIHQLQLTYKRSQSAKIYLHFCTDELTLSSLLGLMLSFTTHQRCSRRWEWTTIRSWSCLGF